MNRNIKGEKKMIDSYLRRKSPIFSRVKGEFFLSLSLFFTPLFTREATSA